jgi:hypothetical protein
MNTRERRTADAWRAVNLAGRPLVAIDVESPREIIREAHLKLRDMRAEARARADRQAAGEVVQ